MSSMLNFDCTGSSSSPLRPYDQKINKKKRHRKKIICAETLVHISQSRGFEVQCVVRTLPLLIIKTKYLESESSSTKHQTGALSLLQIAINKSFPSDGFKNLIHFYQRQLIFNHRCNSQKTCISLKNASLIIHAIDLGHPSYDALLRYFLKKNCL